MHGQQQQRGSRTSGQGSRGETAFRPQGMELKLNAQETREQLSEAIDATIQTGIPGHCGLKNPQTFRALAEKQLTELVPANGIVRTDEENIFLAIDASAELTPRQAAALFAPGMSQQVPQAITQIVPTTRDAPVRSIGLLSDVAIERFENMTPLEVLRDLQAANRTPANFGQVSSVWAQHPGRFTENGEPIVVLGSRWGTDGIFVEITENGRKISPIAATDERSSFVVVHYGTRLGQ